MIGRAPGSTLFPYTTLFRSVWAVKSAHWWPSTPRPSPGCGPAPVWPWPVRASVIVRVAQCGPTLLPRSEEHTSELQSLRHLVCRLLLEKKKHNEKLARDHKT